MTGAYSMRDRLLFQIYQRVKAQEQVASPALRRQRMILGLPIWKFRCSIKLWQFNLQIEYLCLCNFSMIVQCSGDVLI